MTTEDRNATGTASQALSPAGPVNETFVPKPKPAGTPALAACRSRVGDGEEQPTREGYDIEDGEGQTGEEREDFRTPALPRQRKRGGEEEQESPTKKNEGSSRGREENATSSAVKGDAARSLLGLRRHQ